MSTSMRSPGPYGGRPVTKSRFRSAVRSDSVTSKSLESSSTFVPGWRTTYGTIASRRRSRSAVLESGTDGLEACHDGIPHRFGGDDLCIGTEREDPGDEGVGTRRWHFRLGPAVLACAKRSRVRDARQCPPGNLGAERDLGPNLGFTEAPRTGGDVFRCMESRRWCLPLSGVSDRRKDAGQAERPRLPPSPVVSRSEERRVGKECRSRWARY